MAALGEKKLSSGHVPTLDGFRGLAIVLVMLSHFITAGGLVESPGIGNQLLRGGFIGVDLFFVLSGFLITGILLDAPKDGGRYFRVFYLRRAVRIFPLYYAVLVFAFFFRPYSGEDSPAWYWLFASNLGASWKGRWLTWPEGVTLSHLWSLAVEEQFYLVWPLLVRYLNRRTLEKICIACLILAPAANFTLHLCGNSTAAYQFTFTRLNTLGAGALLAIVFRDPARWTRWMSRAPLAALIGGLITLTVLIAPTKLSMVPFSPLLWGALLMLCQKEGSTQKRLFSWAPLVKCGQLSYGLYLLHFLFDPWLKGPVYSKIVGVVGGNTWGSVAVFIVVASLLSYLAAQISWIVLERPFLSLKRFFHYQPKSGTTSPVP